MGACGSKKDKNEAPDGRRESNYQRNETNRMPMGDAGGDQANPGTNTSFNPMKYDHVISNTGNIEQEYELISPPLGQGAFGEVRKAIHRASGLERAVKIIYKDKSDPVELAKIIDEVNLPVF